VALICFLALLLHRVMRQRRHNAGIDHSPDKALRALHRIQRHKVHLAGQTYEGLTKPTAEQLDLFDQLGITIPHQPV